MLPPDPIPSHYTLFPLFHVLSLEASTRSVSLEFTVNYRSNFGLLWHIYVGWLNQNISIFIYIYIYIYRFSRTSVPIRPGSHKSIIPLIPIPSPLLTAPKIIGLFLGPIKHGWLRQRMTPARHNRFLVCSLGKLEYHMRTHTNGNADRVVWVYANRWSMSLGTNS